MELRTEEKKGFKETEIGSLPETWTVKLLDDLSIITRLAGAEYSSVWKEDKTGKIIALRGYNIGHNRIIKKNFTRISDQLSKKLNRSRLKKGDVIYPCVGSIGNAVAIKENNKYHIQQNIARIIPSEKIDSQYLAYFLMSPLGLNEIKRFNATSSQPNVLVSSLRQYRIPLPPSLKEQQAIAEALSDVDELIRSLDALIEKKKAIKKGTMQQLLTGKKRLPGFSGEWEVKRLGEVTTVKKGEMITKNDTIPGNIPVIAGGKTVSYYHSKANRKGKTITISASGAYAGYISYHEQPIFASDCSTIDDTNSIEVGYLFYVLKSRQNEIYDLQTGGAQPHIYPSQITQLSITIPNNIEEQLNIAKVIIDMDYEIQSLQQKHDKYKQIKQGMMQELLTGKTRLV